MTYEQDLEFKLVKYIDPFTVEDYLPIEELESLKAKVRNHFLETRQELLDIRVIGKVHDFLPECTINRAYSETAIKVVETDGKFSVKVTIDPDDPDPASTLEFIARELRLLHPDTEIHVADQNAE